MLIIETMRYHLAPEKRSSMQSKRTKPRKATLGTLYCLGGMDSAKGESSMTTIDSNHTLVFLNNRSTND